MQEPCKEDAGSKRPRRRRGTRLILRPALLLLLAEGDSHGYELMDKLDQLGFDAECLDSSIVYRDLRDMEDMGLIQSSWDDVSKGPKRRVYQVGEEGFSRLSGWLDNLNLLRDQIDILQKRFVDLGNTEESK